MNDASIKIVQRVSTDGHPFSEYFVTWRGHSYYTRNFYVIEDSAHNRGHYLQQFLHRHA